MSPRPQPSRARPRPAVTLLELLVVIAIIGILAALLLTTLAQVRAAGRSVECKNKLKTVALEFTQFADDFSHPFRGDSEKFGRSGFYADDFQERLYGVHEFWPQKGITRDTYDPAAQPLMCPAGPTELHRQAGLPCPQYPVTPAENVSVALNKRLDSASVRLAGRPVLRKVRLSGKILQHPNVPLAFDVDARVAADRGVLPYYAAPPASDAGHYGSGVFWFPALRHGRQMNTAFVGGYVLSSPAPERAGWNWSFQPPPE